MAILDRLTKRDTTFANPASWLIDALGGQKTASGAVVNEENALRLAAVFTCVRVISEEIASLPLKVLKKESSGLRPDESHYLYFLLHDQPNDRMTSFEYHELMTSWLLTRGNAYALKGFDKYDRVTGLYPLRGDRVEPEIRNGRLVYDISDASGRVQTYTTRDIHHLRGLSPDGVVGYSPIRLMREAIGLGLSVDEYGARFFSNGARPGGVLETPHKVTDPAMDRLKKNWREIHESTANAHRIAILEDGMTFKPIGIPPEDAQFLETRKFNRSEIAGIFRVPAHLINDLEKATFSNIEHQDLGFVKHCIRPHVVRFEQAYRRDLLNKNSFSTHTIRFNLDALLRGDLKSRSESYAIGRQWGWLSANDVLRLEDAPTIGDQGDSYLVPMNMRDASEPAPAPESQTTQEPADDKGAK